MLACNLLVLGSTSGGFDWLRGGGFCDIIKSPQDPQSILLFYFRSDYVEKYWWYWIADFTLNIEDTEITWPWHVVELGQADLILAMDFLQEHVSSLELSQGLLTLTNASEVQLFHMEQLSTIQVHTLKTVCEKPKTAPLWITIGGLKSRVTWLNH